MGVVLNCFCRLIIPCLDALNQAIQYHFFISGCSSAKMSNQVDDLPDPEEAALGALVSTICSNCVKRGTTGKDDVDELVERYKPNFPLLTADMIIGGIFSLRAKDKMKSMAMDKTQLLETDHDSSERIVDRIGQRIDDRISERIDDWMKKRVPDSVVGKDKKMAKRVAKKKAKKIKIDPSTSGQDMSTTTIATSISRGDVLNLLTLEFNKEDGQICRIYWASGHRADFVKQHFRDKTPNGLVIKHRGHRILKFGIRDGKLVGARELVNGRGGRDRKHPFEVLFQGLCCAERDGCRTSWTAGFEMAQLQSLADPEVESIEMKMIIVGICDHKRWELHGWGKYKQQANGVTAASPKMGGGIPDGAMEETMTI
ncbi:hypothetical protein ACHAWF_016802 [Thalassiosira exigua]